MGPRPARQKMKVGERQRLETGMVDGFRLQIERVAMQYGESRSSQETEPVTEDDKQTGIEQDETKDVEKNPTPTARSLTGV
ncbi:hypothetical protein F2Q68_00040234 [Brassica cretica]|uniref:Uncharacterized protein n=1 Tax=Brassica cretica TaxID=69181 RepID=A0A8S9MM21_BRACR|nr:hypothetical protein F2Q68_00040234 [Brassica cretica]